MDTALYGQGTSKRVDDLLEEVRNAGVIGQCGDIIRFCYTRRILQFKCISSCHCVRLQEIRKQLAVVAGCLHASVYFGLTEPWQPMRKLHPLQNIRALTAPHTYGAERLLHDLDYPGNAMMGSRVALVNRYLAPTRAHAPD